jgi:cation transport ATPase
VAAIPLAAAGLLNSLAGAAMAASLAFVVANSVRLRASAAAPTARGASVKRFAAAGVSRQSR